MGKNLSIRGAVAAAMLRGDKKSVGRDFGFPSLVESRTTTKSPKSSLDKCESP